IQLVDAVWASASSALPRPAGRQGGQRRGARAMTDELRIGRHTVRITHPDRIVFPEAGVTKLDLARHYERVAAAMVSHVRDRPLALQAYPNGTREPGLFMKAARTYFPSWLHR